MPIPKPNKGEERQDYVSRCIKAVMNEGTADDNKQAAAICFNTWREDRGGRPAAPPEKEKSLVFDALITRAERQKDGRVRWRARANSGGFDQEDERFDESFFEDLVQNFGLVQEALTRSEVPDLPVPILDLAHYSLLIPRAQRAMARMGYVNRLWRDGRALMAEGYFDTTPRGQLAAKAAMEREPDDRRVSVCVWPDWGRVEDTDAGRVYKGGRGVAYLDHLAMTAHPVDADTEIEVLEVKSMGTLKDDATKVLGDSEGAKKEIADLEAARVKSDVVPPAGAVIKTEPEEPVEPVAKADESAPADGAREEAAKAQQARSEQYGIAILPQGSVTKPGEWAALGDDKFGDPVNYRYPMGDDAHIANARSRFAQETESYTGKEKVGARIEAAAKAAGIGEAAKENEPAVPKAAPAEQPAPVVPAAADPTETIAKALRDFLPQIALAVDERLKPLAELPAQLAALQSEVDALKAPTAEKVKAALDGDGDWLTQLIKSSVQRPDKGTVKGEGKPAEQVAGAYAATFGNPTRT